jgi:hypothetical protein
MAAQGLFDRRGALSRWLREPMLHFLLIGAALFLYYDRAGPVDETRRIVVDQALIDELARRHEATWMRPPTAEELAGLVDAYVHEEVLYREGVALGLDRDDAVVKRRVRQMLDVMSEEAIASAPPSEADLTAYLEAHAADFRRPAVVTYRQILVASTDEDSDVAKGLEEARVALARGVDPAAIGRPSLLPSGETNAPLDQVTRTFGDPFAAAIAEVAVGEWAGPVASGFGAHLVRVDERTPALVPPLDQVRSAVAREWEADRRRRALATEYERMRAKYAIVNDVTASEAAER